MIGFTAYALYSANGVVKQDVVLVHAPVVWIGIVSYSLLLIMVLLSWFEGLRVIKKGRSKIPKQLARRAKPERKLMAREG